MRNNSNEELQETWDRFVLYGDEADFRKVYDSYWLKLFKVSFNILKDKHLSEDVVQDIFTSLWKKGKDEHHEPINQINHYLLRSAKLKVFQLLRNMKIRSEHLKTLDKVRMVNNVEEKLAFNETNDLFEKCIDKLPNKTRIVFRQSRVENKTNREISEDLNLSIKTIEGHITFALKSLREEFSAYAKLN